MAVLNSQEVLSWLCGVDRAAHLTGLADEDGIDYRVLLWRRSGAIDTGGLDTLPQHIEVISANFMAPMRFQIVLNFAGVIY